MFGFDLLLRLKSYFTKDTFFSAFQGNIFLRTVDLSFNGFAKEGAVALGQALKENTILEELNVRYEPLLSWYLII